MIVGRRLGVICSVHLNTISMLLSYHESNWKVNVSANKCTDRTIVKPRWTPGFAVEHLTYDYTAYTIHRRTLLAAQ
jgi:hypothetical protein